MMSPELYRFCADLVVAFHAAFAVFVLLGGLLVAWKPGLAWAHVPAAIWGTLIEFGGWVCPLTPLENRLRALSGSASYRESFVQHHLLPLLYPISLTRRDELVLGGLVLALNVAVYWRIARRWLRS